MSAPNRMLRDSFEQRDARLLNQAFRIIADDLHPYYSDGKEYKPAVEFWTGLHDKISRELGLSELSQKWFSYTTKWNGADHIQTSQRTMLTVCENWMIKPLSGSPDEHIKERLSLIELGFRETEARIAAKNASPISEAEQFISVLDRSVAPGIKDKKVRALTIRNAKSALVLASIDELNARFRQAKYPLNYHNGFIQFSTDNLIQSDVETPFWDLMKDPIWKNVDQDMKEALDLRDTDGRDPAFYAARALESAIKIISDKKGWTHGGEKGAHSYIENLASKKNAFILAWEGTSLKEFFTHVRNPFGHGAGSLEMPSLSRPQIEWAIEFSMSWIKSLIRRL